MYKTVLSLLLFSVVSTASCFVAPAWSLSEQDALQEQGIAKLTLLEQKDWSKASDLEKQQYIDALNRLPRPWEVNSNVEFGHKSITGVLLDYTPAEIGLDSSVSTISMGIDGKKQDIIVLVDQEKKFAKLSKQRLRLHVVDCPVLFGDSWSREYVLKSAEAVTPDVEHFKQNLTNLLASSYALIHAYQDVLVETHLYALKLHLAYKISGETIGTISTLLFTKSPVKGAKAIQEALQAANLLNGKNISTSLLDAETVVLITRSLLAASTYTKASHYSQQALDHAKDAITAGDYALSLYLMQEASAAFAQALFLSQEHINLCLSMGQKNFLERAFTHSFAVSKATAASVFGLLKDAIIPPALQELTKPSAGGPLLGEFEACALAFLSKHALTFVDIEKKIYAEKQIAGILKTVAQNDKRVREQKEFYRRFERIPNIVY